MKSKRNFKGLKVFSGRGQISYGRWINKRNSCVEGYTGSLLNKKIHRLDGQDLYSLAK